MTNAQQSNPTPEEKALQNLILAPDLQRLEDLLAEFNLFDVLEVWHRELQHSAFLAWLLNPRGSHGLRDYFLRRFLSEAARAAQEQGVEAPTPFDVDSWALIDVEVVRERHHIDILILSGVDHFACLIENKIFSREIPGQLREYLNTVEQEYTELIPFPVFLTPEGIEPQEKEDAERYVPLSYQQVASILDRTLETRRTTMSASVEDFLKQYTDALRKHVMDTRTNVQELAYQIYNNHQEAIDLIIEAKAKPTQRWDLIEPIIEQYSEFLKYDSRARYLVRYYATHLEDIPELHQAEGWSPTNRILLFEFKYVGDEVILYLYLGPGPEQLRRRIFQIAQQNNAHFETGRTLASKWNFMYRKPIFNRSDDPAAIGPKVKRVIAELLKNDYWPMVNAIRAEFDPQPTPASG